MANYRKYLLSSAVLVIGAGLLLISYASSASAGPPRNPVMLSGWPFATAAGVNTSPAVADLDRDGFLDVVIGAEDGRVYALNYHGQVLPGWPQERGAQSFLSTPSSPAIADINLDGQLEVIIGDSNGGVYVWRRNGEPLPGWPKLFADSEVYASPAVASIDSSSPGLEIVISVRNKTTGTGYIYVFRPDGTVLDGWPKELSDVFVDHAASIGNLDRNAPGLEIVVPVNEGMTSASTAYGFYANGAPLPGWPISVERMFWGSPALADINRDAQLEVVQAATYGSVMAWTNRGILLPGWSQVEAWSYVSPAITELDRTYAGYEVVFADLQSLYVKHADGTDMNGWPVSLPSYMFAAPSLADLDGDGKVEIICGLDNGKVYAWDSFGRLLSGWPVSTGSSAPLFSSAAVADLNRDNKLEVIVGSSGGGVYAWTMPVSSRDRSPWPTFHHDVLRTGHYNAPAVSTPFATPTPPPDLEP